MTNSIKHFDVMPISAMTGFPSIPYAELNSFKEKLSESHPEFSICIPNDLFEGIDTHSFTAKDFLREIVSHMAHVRCIVTMPGWEQDSNCQTLISIARQLKIHVISAEIVKHAMQNGTNWIPADDRN